MIHIYQLFRIPRPPSPPPCLTPSLIVGASMGPIAIGRSLIVGASMGSTTMGRSIVFALNGLYHNGQINDIFCLNGLYHNGYRMLLFCPTTMGRLLFSHALHVVYYLCRAQNHISCKKHVCIQLEILTSLGKLSTDKNSTPGSKTIKPSFRACKYILSRCNN